MINYLLLDEKLFSSFSHYSERSTMENWLFGIHFQFVSIFLEKDQRYEQMLKCKLVDNFISDHIFAIIFQIGQFV